MAMFDDYNFLVSHIRNSFVTSDETGMSELIIDVEDGNFRSPEKRPTTWHGNRAGGNAAWSESGPESDTELSHSYDILPDMDFAAHRRRSNTAQRLEKLKREKHKQSKIRHVSWKESNIPAEEFMKIFEKKDVPLQLPNKKMISALSQLLENSAAGENPFIEFAKFDGKVHAGLPVKKLSIYLTMAHPEDRPFPMTVVTLASAKIQDLIGLICWQYRTEGRRPELLNNIEAYSLHIAEDDGEVDMDFPKLDNREPIQKFGFSKLALVEKELSKVPEEPNSCVVVTINMPHRGFSKVPVDSAQVLMKEVLSTVLKRRKLRQMKNLEYTLEKQDEPGLAVDLESTLASMDTLEFCLVRENSIRGDIEPDEISASSSAIAESLSSHQYRSYQVTMGHKLRTNTDVQLGISGDKIEIDPISKSKLFKQNALTYDIENIAICDIAEERSSGKATMRLVYKVGHDYKHHDFEADNQVCREIVNKVNNILEMRASPVRKEYMEHRRRKLEKRHTIGFP